MRTWIVAAALLVPAGGGVAQSARNAMIYVGTYDDAITIIDEATGAASGRIPLRTGIPRTMILSANRSHFYVTDASYENVEVVDIATRTTLDVFSLSRGNRKVRIWGTAVDPKEQYGVFLVKTYWKLPDRFDVSGPSLVKVDLKTHEVTDTIPWPDGREQDGMRMLFSPDGKLLYLFADDIVVLDTSTFEEIDRWRYSESLDPGMGRFEFGFPEHPYEDRGTYTGLFTLRDSVQNRQIMGIARVRLSDRQVDFSPLGPAQTIQLALAPGGQKAYGVHSEVGNWQLWTFDLEGKRVVNHAEFRGRPRMRLITSSDGNQLYIYLAGNTIDVYDAASYRYLKTITLNGDTTTDLFVLPRSKTGD